MSESRAWLPVLLGLLAAGGNYLFLHQHAATTEVVALRKDLKPGEKIAADHLRPVAVRGGDELFASTVRWADHAALLGKTVCRKVGGGELVLRAEIDHESFQLLPVPPGFRSLTVPVRPAALAGRPGPGGFVYLHLKGTSAGQSAAGPFFLLGWVSGPAKEKDKEADTVFVTVAVPADVPDPQVAELQRVRETHNADRVYDVAAYTPPAVPANPAK